MNDKDPKITEIPTDENVTGIDVGKRLDISEAGLLRDQLLQALNGPDPRVEVSLAEVEVVDAAGLQLLVAFAREAGLRGKHVGFNGLPEAARKSLALLGLSEQLG